MLNKIVVLLSLLAALTLAQQVYAVPASFQWGSFSAAGSSSYGVYDSDNTTILSSGDLVQLIWTGPNGSVDAPNSDGTAGGDDLLLATTTVQNGGAYPPPLQDKGYVPLATLTFDSDAAYAGGTVYLRAWNAASLAEANAYGDSTTATLSDHAVHNATRWHTQSAPTAVTLQHATSHPAAIATHMLLLIAVLFTLTVYRLLRRPIPI